MLKLASVMKNVYVTLANRELGFHEKLVYNKQRQMTQNGFAGKDDLKITALTFSFYINFLR